MRYLSNLRLWMLLTATVGYPAWAEGQETADCYDTVVVAQVMKQTPSAFPDSDDGSIVMAWPWFLKLKVKRAVTGDIAARPIVVLSLQHTDFRKDLGLTRWWLRRNSLGGFNLLRLAESDGLSKCAPDEKPAAPFIRPGPGQTIDSLLKDAERADRAQG